MSGGAFESRVGLREADERAPRSALLRPARDGPRPCRVVLVEAQLPGLPVRRRLPVDPARVRLPGGLLAGAEGRADLRPGGTGLARRTNGELTPVRRLAGHHLAQREKFQEPRPVERLGVAPGSGERLPYTQLVETGHGGQQGVLRLDALWCRHTLSVAS